MKPSLSNIEIANRAELWPISEVAEKKLGLSVQDLEPFGWFKAKVPLSLINLKLYNKMQIINQFEYCSNYEK